MKITLTYKHGEYTVTVNDYPHTFYSSRDAWEFIFALKKEVA